MRRLKLLGAPLALYAFVFHLLVPVASALAVDTGARTTLLVVCGVEGLRAMPLDPAAPGPDDPDAEGPAPLSFCPATGAGCASLLPGGAHAGPTSAARLLVRPAPAREDVRPGTPRSPIRSARGPPEIGPPA